MLVRTPDAVALRARLENAGAWVEARPDGAMMVQGLEAPAIGKLAAEGGRCCTS